MNEVVLGQTFKEVFNFFVINSYLSKRMQVSIPVLSSSSD